MANAPYDPRRPERQSTLAAIEAGDMDRLYLSLSPRQRLFCQEYIVDFNGKAAAIRAGYATKWADRQATLLLKHKGVAKYINCLQESTAAKIVAVDPDYVIQQVTAIIGKPGAKDSDRLRGLELLARHLGMFVDRTEITGKDGGPLETRRVEEEASNFTNLLRQLSERSRKESNGKLHQESNQATRSLTSGARSPERQEDSEVNDCEGSQGQGPTGEGSPVRPDPVEDA